MTSIRRGDWVLWTVLCNREKTLFVIETLWPFSTSDERRSWQFPQIECSRKKTQIPDQMSCSVCFRQVQESYKTNTQNRGGMNQIQQKNGMGPKPELRITVRTHAAALERSPTSVCTLHGSGELATLSWLYIATVMSWISGKRPNNLSKDEHKDRRPLTNSSHWHDRQPSFHHSQNASTKQIPWIYQQTFCAAQGIIHQIICSYTSMQTGIIKRKKHWITHYSIRSMSLTIYGLMPSWWPRYHPPNHMLIHFNAKWHHTKKKTLNHTLF